MRNYGVVAILLTLIIIVGCSEQNSFYPGKLSSEQITIDVWPQGYLGESGKSRGVNKPDEGDNIIRLTDVTIPSMTVYKAKGSGPRPAVLVCPGGGYHILAMDLEGTEIAAWLNSEGITAIILRYRVPNNADGAFQDGQRAMSVIRHRAKEFNIDPDKVGAIGFSAGANLSAKLCTNFANRSYQPIDDADKKSCRPDFAMLVYPYLLEEENKNVLAKNLPVTSKTPPAILIHAQDDWVRPESSIVYFEALKKAKVPAELHIFPSGGHGYGLRPSKHAVSGWPKLCNTWLKGILKKD